MTDFDIYGLVHNINMDNLQESITESSLSELICVYKALSEVTAMCLRFANIPAVAYVLSELSYAYSLEITNRYLSAGIDLRDLQLPDSLLPLDMR